MKFIIKIIYDVLLDKVVKVLGITLVLVILLQIGGRYLLTLPFSWTEELARFLFIWFAFLGSVITLRSKMHLGIEFFYQKLKPKSKRSVDIFIQLVILFFGVLIAKYGFQLVELGEISKSPVLRWPMSYFYLSIPITGILFAIYSFYSLLTLFKTPAESSKVEG
ncbi:TRAP transporter small permease [Halalkalibacter kiskunsagensis]|uniref:TRAP transporter small permease n=1 Tax=Halalkalibacter kiskunsagensis TaxID=1548599 RepID=A0ABV6KDC7_9BACI